MNEKDKILLNSYLDGEISENDAKKVKNLLKNDVRANEYLNDLKSINAQLYAEAEAEVNTNSYRDSRKFVEEEIIQKLETSNSGFLSFFENIALRNVLTYSIIAGVFFNFGTFFESNKGYSIIEEGEYNLLKMRSKDATNNQIQTIIEDMIENKFSTAKINSENFERIYISTSSLNSECILFELVGTKNSIGKYCPEEEYFYINEIY